MDLTGAEKRLLDVIVSTEGGVHFERERGGRLRLETGLLVNRSTLERLCSMGLAMYDGEGYPLLPTPEGTAHHELVSRPRVSAAAARSRSTTTQGKQPTEPHERSAAPLPMATESTSPQRSNKPRSR